MFSSLQHILPFVQQYLSKMLNRPCPSMNVHCVYFVMKVNVMLITNSVKVSLGSNVCF